MLLHGILLSLLAGLSITAGAGLARVRFFKKSWENNELRKGIVAFGGGALMAAIAFVLVPEGIKHQAGYSAILSFIAGGVVFMGIDYVLARRGGCISQMLAMMLDFVPEAIVLGAIVTQDIKKAVFLAIIIAAQNLPEGYGAYTEMSRSKNPPKKLLLLFLILGLSGPLYILLGAKVFVNMQDVLSVMMTFCAGGILYLIFQDIAPEASDRRHYLAPIGAVLGFTIGLAGHLYIG